MKKLFALLVVAGMAFASCGNTNKEAEQVEEVGTETEVVTDDATTQDDAAQADVETSTEAQAE